MARYLPALRAHLVYKRRVSPDQADDLVQEFVASKILESDLVARADRELGKFRTFLLTAIDRFLLNQIRDERAKKRAPSQRRLVGLDDWTDCLGVEDRPSEVFDVAWARSVLSEALERMRRECEATGRADVWGGFECRVVAPLLEGSDPVDYRQLVERFGFRTPTQAANALTTGKRSYARALRSVVGEYARDEGEIDSEIAQLQQVLAGSSG